MFFFYFQVFFVCVESDLLSLQMAQGDIRSLYKRSLQHKVEYLHLKKQKLRGEIELQQLMKKKIALEIELLQKKLQTKY